MPLSAATCSKAPLTNPPILAYAEPPVRSVGEMALPRAVFRD
jgi:hypothetical protein